MHNLQERYAKLVDAKLRATMVKRDNVIFNTRYEGDPKAGVVKIPVRNTEVEVVSYNKANGVDGTTSTTTYIDMPIDKDYAVNELIDGYDAAAVPDNLTAERLDSAAYSLALQSETDATAELEKKASTFGTTTALTAATVYQAIVDARTTLSKNKVPNDSRRFLLVSPEVMGYIFSIQKNGVGSDALSEQIKQTGAVARIAGFNVYEDVTLSEKTEFIAGHPDWCHHVNEWKVPIHLQDLSGSGKFIGASAVQGRNVYGYLVSNSKALIKKVKA